MTAAALADAAFDAGVTYRQADHWCRRGFVRASRKHEGQGYPRHLDPAEAAVLSTMARLVAAGLTPETAALVAREGNGRGRYELADGVHIVLTAPVQKGP